jgi:hypothetical protein
MFSADVFPELGADEVATLSYLDMDNFPHIPKTLAMSLYGVE